MLTLLNKTQTDKLLIETYLFICDYKQLSPKSKYCYMFGIPCNVPLTINAKFLTITKQICK